MKIVNQLVNSLSSLKSTAPTSTVSGEIDFRSTFTAAVASSDANGTKIAPSQDGKKRNLSSQTTLSNDIQPAVVPQTIATPIVALQGTVASPSAVTTTNDGVEEELSVAVATSFSPSVTSLQPAISYKQTASTQNQTGSKNDGAVSGEPRSRTGVATEINLLPDSSKSVAAVSSDEVTPYLQPDSSDGVMPQLSTDSADEAPVASIQNEVADGVPDNGSSTIHASEGNQAPLPSVAPSVALRPPSRATAPDAARAASVLTAESASVATNVKAPSAHVSAQSSSRSAVSSASVQSPSAHVFQIGDGAPTTEIKVKDSMPPQSIEGVSKQNGLQSAPPPSAAKEATGVSSHEPLHQTAPSSQDASPDAQGQTAAEDSSASEASAALQSAITAVTTSNVSVQGKLPQPSFQAVAAKAGSPGTSTDIEGKTVASHQAVSNVKGKANTSDLRDRHEADSDDDGGSPDATPSTPFPVKIAEGLPVVNQSATVAANGVDTAAIQQTVQANQAATALHAQPATPSATTVPAATVPSQASVSSASADVSAVPSINSAQLIQSMQHSEMRLGMQSAEFGNISINTSLNHQSLSAQISIDHSELSRALAVHMPAIEEKLSAAYGVQARVEVRDGGNNNTASSFSNSGQQSKDNRQSQSAGRANTVSATLERANAFTSATTPPLTAGTSRLDILI